MTGTEKILKHISEQAQAEAGRILEEAREKAAAIGAAAEKEAAALREAGELKAQTFSREAKERLAASLASQSRRASLAVKGELVQEALNRAYERLLALPEEDYFAFLYQQLEKQVGSGSGILQLNQRDLDRLPWDFMRQTQAIAEKKGGSLTLSPEAADIDGGFLLSYGGILENGSLAAIFEARADELKDAVCAVLFTQE